MRTISLLFTFVLAVPAATLTVGTAAAAAGEKANGYIQVPAGVDAAASIPVIVINGAKPGPTLALVAGAHGTEYASIIALERVAQTADPAAISGALIVLPLLNTASFAQKVPHLNPVDGKNMNRFYPGKADGTQTERISWAITNQVIAKADYLLDFHGGDLDENLRRYAYWPETGKPELDAAARKMVLAFGLDHIIVQNFRTPSASVTITRYAESIGKPAIAVEAGHAGTVHGEDVDVLVEGVWSVMRHHKMLPGAPHPVERPLWIGRYTGVPSEHDGIFYPLALPEAYVQKGMPIGYITDYFGKKITDVVSPVNGVVLYIGAVPSMKKGDNIANIGELM